MQTAVAGMGMADLAIAGRAMPERRVREDANAMLFKTGNPQIETIGMAMDNVFDGQGEGLIHLCASSLR